MKIKRIPLLIMLIILTIFVITNPSKLTHTIAVESKAAQLFGSHKLDSLQQAKKAQIEDSFGIEGTKQVKRIYGPFATDLASQLLSSIDQKLHLLFFNDC